MTYEDLIRRVAARERLSLRAAAGLVQFTFASIRTEVLGNGRRVVVPRFGSFRRVVRPARDVRIPRAAADGSRVVTTVFVPSARKLAFTPSKHART